ncbi:G-protein-signaling modulator 2 isoform X1 [Dermochelys coriacea]|uniref:G-protein-signaling modulator 2 isoform X1 n=2 Tax=Dermochelys coriacea TaxID=27794 RepID=UPI0018E80F07|nr:G-protein-signaling modulator 2 isoform X1 [Dermochelys coriacea]XP_038270154.1 G-protein-signaling modulator 2 isoform X1 [Dermochelys coriacea]XP_038270156.1 G-protein-signaling modulator 2 isoform X1 [Dermochelys coriacea]
MEESNVLISMREDHSFHVRYRMEASCLELALEGERLCKAGDCRAGVSFFEAAVQVGTEDLKTLSAIYSQLGNAYFYLHEYAKALEYHHHDLTLARTIGDQLGEAKASGNLGNTLKVLGNFEDAIVCCQRHLDISRELNDKVGEARALYNLGNVYHSKGKNVACAGTHDPGELPDEVKAALQKAADYYEENLTIVTELGDRAAQGRAYGNLGNTHYLLGNFRNAVIAHEQRLLIAKEFGDRAAERRAYSNLGNAYIFLGEFESASEYYKKTLQLARQLKDRAVEAQACYSLGNTYTLLQDYEKAIDYHLKHLTIAQELNDRVGEGRACWSLGNAYTALGNHDQAMHFAEKHLEISREVGDRSGELTARLNLSDLQMVLGLSYSTNNSVMSEIHTVDNSLNGARSRVGRRHSMENMELMKLTPEKIQNWNSDILAKQKPLVAKPSAKLHFVNRLKGKKYKNGTSSKVLQDASNSIDHRLPSCQRKNSPDMTGDEGFFDLLSRFQSNRMDDQRCCFQEKSRMTAAAASSTPSKTMRKSFSTSMVSPHTDEFLDLLASSQSRRLDDQRANFSNLPGLRLNQHNSQSVLGHLMASNNRESDDDFFDILIKCQGSRLDDQRCAPPSTATKGPTVPDEDFFSLILRSQAKRMDEQRVPLPLSTKRPNPNKDF